MERESLFSDVKGQARSGSNREGESTEAERRDGAARRRDEGPVMGLERGGCVVQPRPLPTAAIADGGAVDEAKPFKIPKRDRGSLQTCEGERGAAGVDGQTTTDFEGELRTLYKL